MVDLTEQPGPSAPGDAETRLDGFETIANELGGWWERERATFVRSRLRTRVQPGSLVLDVGSGPATMLGAEPLGEGVRCVSCDSYRYPQWGREHTNSSYVIASASHLPFREAAFDLVASFDVLEHIDDDRLAISEQARVCTPGGAVMAAVPAFPSLWSQFDVSVGHHRRYTRDSLTALAASAGLARSRATYFYSWLYPPAWLVRNRAARNSEPGTGTGLVATVVDRVISIACRAERALLGRVDLPVGTSLWSEFSRSRT